MVGWSRRNREASERAARAAAREKACIDGGCKCYCHAPRQYKDDPLWKIIVGALLFVGFWVALFWFVREEQAVNPPEPYVCNSITSTGAPTDCHPVVLPPDVLKQYEDHFKQK